MKETKLVKLTIASMAIMGIVIVVSAFSFPQSNLQKLSLDLTARTLFQGKSISAVGTVYYKTQNGLMVTKMKTPIDQVVMTTATGEFKSYNVADNTVIQNQGSELSSKSSFIYSFLSGKTNDMGLSDLGYKLTDSRNESGVIVNTWMAPTDRQFEAQKVEIAFEDYLPIYMGFHDGAGEVIQKTFYTNYQNVSYIRMPLNITEIVFYSEADSSITQRKYSNLKLNKDVDDQWLNFQIPADAKVMAAPSFNEIPK